MITLPLLLVISSSTELGPAIETTCHIWGLSVSVTQVSRCERLESISGDDQPDLIVLDAPTEDAYQMLLPQLRYEQPSAAIILLLPTIDPRSYQTVLCMGANDVLASEEIDQLPRVLLRELFRQRTEASHTHATTNTGEASRSAALATPPTIVDLQRLFLTNTVPMWIYDLDTLAFLAVNDAAVVKYGYSRAEFLSMTIKEIRPTEDVARLLTYLQDSRPIFLQSGKWRHQLRDGTIITVEINSQVITYAGRRASFVVAYDVTDREKAEEAMRASHALYHTLVDSFNNVVTIADGDGRFHFVNEVGWKPFNLTPEQRFGKTAHDLFSKETADLFVERVRDVIQTGRSRTDEDCVQVGPAERWYQSTIVPLHGTDGAVSRVLTNAVDITTLKETQFALQRSAQRLQGLYNVNKAILAAHTVEQIATSALRHLTELVPCHCSWVTTLDYQTLTTPVVAAHAVGATPIPDNLHYQFPLSAMQTDDLYFLTLYTADHPDATIRLLYANGLRTTLTIGLKAEGRLIGGLFLSACASGFFNEESIEIALKVADQLAVAIHTAQLHEQLRHYTTELEARVERRTEQLERAKTRVEAILHSSSEGILLIDTGYGIQQANATFHLLFRCATDAYLGRSLDLFVLLPDRALLATAVQSVLDQQSPQRIEVTALRPDGTVFAAEFGLASVQHYAAHGTQFVCTIRDVSERKRVQQALIEEHNLLRTLIDTIPDLIYVKDSQHRFVLSNVAHAHTLGYTSPDALIGKSDFDFVWPEVAERSQADEEKILKTGQPLLDNEEPGHKGEASWTSSTKVPLRNMNGEVIGIVGITRDITERKAVERQLRYFASIQESVSDAVISTDMAYRIQSWNKAAEKIYGWRAEEVLGRTVTEVLQTQFASEEERERIIQEFLLHGYYRMETTQRRRDGTRVHILSSVSLLKDEAGAAIGAVAINHDITERKQAEDALQQALQKEKELHELKSRFVAMASHEFRTPLAVILATTETLLAYRQRMDEAKINSRLDRIRQQVTHLNGITEDILELNSIQAKRIDFVPVVGDWDALCRTIIEEFESTSDYHERIVYHCAEPPVLAAFDPRLLRQVITNLIANALKYSSLDKKVHLDLSQNESQSRLQVQDEGIGIPPEDIAHLFMPFHRAGNVGAIDGTGLGLSIAKQAIELHGGAILVESQLGAGTTFTVIIPTTNSQCGAEL